MQRNWTVDEDGQLLEMLLIDCHRAIIAKALDRTEMEIRARIVLSEGIAGERRKLHGQFGGKLMKCLCCEDTGWVCEDHPDQPWQDAHACTCGGAGAPCPRCNFATPGLLPRLPLGFHPDEGD
jgi:hypothetical protein